MALLETGSRIITNTGLFLRYMRYEIIKEFSDFLILSKLNGGSCSGYDIINYYRTNYGVLLSSGNVYSQLSRMESLGLLKSRWIGRKRFYRLTAIGALFLQKFQENIFTIQIFINKLFANEFKNGIDLDRPETGKT